MGEDEVSQSLMLLSPVVSCLDSLKQKAHTSINHCRRHAAIRSGTQVKVLGGRSFLLPNP